MSTTVITEINCDFCGASGPKALESEDVRHLAIREDWRIDDDGDYCTKCREWDKPDEEPDRTEPEVMCPVCGMHALALDESTCGCS